MTDRKEYIERGAVERMLENAQMVSDGEYSGYCTEDISLDEIPTADVVEVVRCSQCKYWHRGDCYRLELSRPDDYCSYGERKGTS